MTDPSQSPQSQSQRYEQQHEQPQPPVAMWSLSYGERAERYWVDRHPMAYEFLRLMERKRSNLSVAADLTRKSDLLALADQVGPYICLLKVS